MSGLTDIARAARVSIATVSRAVNNPATVNEKTRRRVERAMERLNYRPNRVARRLRQSGGRRHLLGLIVPEIENPHFADIARGVEDAAYAQKFAVMLCNADDDPAKERFYLDLLHAESVDGVIVPPIGDRDTVLKAAVEGGLPLVAVDRRLRGTKVDTVMVDNRAGARLAVEHLIARGYRRIAHLAGPQRISTARERQETWTSVLTDHGLPVRDDYLWRGDHRQDSGAAGAAALLKLRVPPQALFVSNNLMTAGALETIHRRGLAVPSDIAVICFDDPPWARVVRPGLTTIRQPTREIGRMAVELLLRRLNDPKASLRKVMLAPELVVRGST